MAFFKCKMCGGDLDVHENVSVVECEYCGTKQTIPSMDNEKKTNLFNRANRLRISNEFDSAASVYENIIAEFPEESEAYWGRCLCKYGIEYVDDLVTARKIPTCHRTQYTSIFEDNDFELALKYTDPVAKNVYRAEADEIDRLQKAILDIAQKEEPFDVFICYKETAEDGQRTKDSVMAQDIYDALTAKGYKVFFSRITLEDKLGQEYEPYIFSALTSAKVMLAIGTKYDYYNAAWVKNEWGRFLSMMKNDKSKVLIPCYADIDAYDMPQEFRNLQGQDMSKIGFMQDLVRGIEKIIGKKNQVQNKAIELDSIANNDFNEIILRSNGEDLISRIASYGGANSNDLWPKGAITSTVNLNKYPVIVFNIFLNKKIGKKGSSNLGLVIYDDYGNVLLKNETNIAVEENYDRFSKIWILKDNDGNYVNPGYYWAVIWIDDSKAVKYKFQVTLSDEPQKHQTLSEKSEEELQEEIKQSEKKYLRVEKFFIFIFVIGLIIQILNEIFNSAPYEIVEAMPFFVVSSIAYCVLLGALKSFSTISNKDFLKKFYKSGISAYFIMALITFISELYIAQNDGNLSTESILTAAVALLITSIVILIIANFIGVIIGKIIKFFVNSCLS